VKIPEPDNAEEFTLNLTPMIDVVFLLLIFFMLAGSLEPPDLFDLELPETSSAQPAETEPRPVVLTLGARGDLAIDGVAVERNALIAKLRRDTSGTALREDTPLHLRADARTPARVLRPLLDELRSAGVSELALVTVDAS